MDWRDCQSLCRIFADSRVFYIAGYGFVYFEDKWDAEDAIRKLHRYRFGYEKRSLWVEWGRGEVSSRHDDGSYQKPTKTLFVCNFDPFKTKEIDIEEHFKPYGKVVNVRIRSSYSFVQFATQEDATKALEATQRSQIMGKVIHVEYGLKDDDERDDRRGGRSPKRSLTPAYHSRRIPDYARPRIPEYDRRRSPSAYDRHRSPAAYDRRRSPAAYDRRRSPSAYERRRSPAAYDRRRSPAAYDRRRSPSAYERNRDPEAYDRRRCPDYGRRSYGYGSQRSPRYDRYRSRSPVAVPSGRKAEEEYEKNAEPEATKNVCDTMVSRQ
ncbi:Serine/arginine-rich splicing factor RS31 [Raphanus sativus]|nr:Serine/arginine-rich splicing factor RS31 [Raphanus sativus]